ncbi:translation elongation factor 2 [Mycena amicta]|nr:translation elongation factor 2 [Mycena amicta]
MRLTLRGISTAAHDPRKIRNIALVAHIDSGKTTLTESILLRSSYLSSSGSVDTGSTTTDFLPAERERGITIQAASIPVRWKDYLFNLIDTPGHADFGMEVESASRVVDGAVVLIDSVEGVESQTKGVWRQLDRYGVPTRIMFLNKLDRPGASFGASMSSLLAHRLHPHPVALTLPIASFNPQDYSHAEPGIQGIVDLVNWDIWQWKDPESDPTRHPLPANGDDLAAGAGLLVSSHPIIPHLAPARTALLDRLAMSSEELMDTLLELPGNDPGYLDLDNSVLMRHLRQATLRNEVLPILCGAAAKNIGTDLVMDYVGALLASPLDLEHDQQRNNPPVKLLAWKVTWDKRLGWMTFVRVYSGSVTRKTSLVNTTRGEKERISKLMLLYASQPEEVEELPFGTVGVLLGLKHTRTGDTLESSGARSKNSLREITTPPAVIAVSVIPNSHSDLQPVQDALAALSRTDPSLRVDTQEGQLLAHGLGALHLEIVEGRLRDEWGVHFQFGARRVSFREGLGPAISSEPQSRSWKTDVGGIATTVNITLALRPLDAGETGDPLWDGNVVVRENGEPFEIPNNSASGSPNTFVAQGLASALSNSPHTALQMSHVHIRVCKVDLPANAPASILTGAAAVIVRECLREAEMGPVLEPFVNVKVSVNEDSLGKAVKDLTEHGAEVFEVDTGSAADEVGGYPELGNYIPPLELSPSGHVKNGAAGSPRMKRTINAVAPLSQMLDYSNRLRALSGGHGVFETANAGFRVVSDSRRTDILREIGRA